MRVLYCFPSLESVYAGRFIFEGYHNAFVDMGHAFRPFTSNDDLQHVLDEFSPNIFIYSLNAYQLGILDLELLKRYRQRGLIVFCQVRAWNETANIRVEAMSSALKFHEHHVSLIRGGLAGDVFWHWFEQDEPLMDGFTKATGRTFETIHLAADKTQYFPQPDCRFECDLCYVGSYLPLKRAFFRKHVLPLRRSYDIRIYGSDWTLGNRLLGKVQKAGQYFNIDPLKKVRSLGLPVADERKLYSSARISLNVHEEQVKVSNCEINERTFKILACGGFQLSDNVRLLRRFFTERELIIAESTDDWFDKIEFYMKNPERRSEIAAAGRDKVLREHTYHNRVRQIVDLASAASV